MQGIYTQSEELIQSLMYGDPIYEEVSEAIRLTLLEADKYWAERYKVSFAYLAPPFVASVNPIAAAYGSMIQQLAVLTIGGNNPLAHLTSVGSLTWGLSLPYATVLLRGEDEATNVESIIPFGEELAMSIRAHVRLMRGRPISQYVHLVTIPAILECMGRVVPELGVDVFPEQALSWSDEIAGLPRGQYGAYPAYAVTADDTLETIAFKIYGDPQRYPEIIASYDLYPPYIVPLAEATPNTNGVLTVGSQLILPNNIASVSYEEALGLNWTIDTVGAGLEEQWDWVALPDGGLEAVGGLGALEVSLIARVNQPLDDWKETDVVNYGVPNVVIGQNITSAEVQQFALSQALAEDDRIFSVAPQSDSAAYATGLVFDNLLVSVKVPEGLARDFKL